MSTLRHRTALGDTTLRERFAGRHADGGASDARDVARALVARLQSEDTGARSRARLLSRQVAGS